MDRRLAPHRRPLLQRLYGRVNRAFREGTS